MQLSAIYRERIYNIEMAEHTDLEKLLEQNINVQNVTRLPPETTMVIAPRCSKSIHKEGFLVSPTLPSGWNICNKKTGY